MTFTGGEPFAQAGALAELGRLCRQAGLSVLTYTGYEYARIGRSSRRTWKALLDATDLLLAGPFVKDLADSSRPWVGSKNQEFVFLTNRYQHLRRHVRQGHKELEVRVEPGGMALNGTAPELEIAAIQRDLADLGLDLELQRS